MAGVTERTTTMAHHVCRSLVERLSADPAAHRDYEEQLASIRRAVVASPVIYVGTGTCGLGAGAGETQGQGHLVG